MLLAWNYEYKNNLHNMTLSSADLKPPVTSTDNEVDPHSNYEEN